MKIRLFRPALFLSFCLIVGSLLIPRSATAQTVYRINISGVIDLGMAEYVKRGIRVAEAGNAEAVVLHINTPGGRVDAAVQICDALFTTPLKTLSFIDSQAISAGALIAVSTSKIGMTDYATIGDIEPKPTSEKAVSYISGRLRAAAEKYGRPADILAAMADKDMEIEGVTAKGKLVTLTTEEALRYKVAEYQARNLDDFLKLAGYPKPEVKEVTITWSEILVRAITHPLISPMLMTLGFLGIFIEIRTPGFGIPGIGGLAFLALFFGGHFLAGLAGWEALLCFVVGLALIAMEVLVITGFGVVGVAGIVSVFVSLFLALSGIGNIPAPLINYQRAWNGLSIFAALTIILLYFIIKRLPKTELWHKLALTESLATANSGEATGKLRKLNLGDQGTTRTPLRPVGKALLNDKLVEVVTEGEFIGEGEKVRVLELSGNRVVVKKDE